MSPHTVGYDMRCIGCEYNLRSLAFSGRCPECGVSVIYSATAAAEAILAGERDPLLCNVEIVLSRVASRASQSREAMQLIYDSLLYAMQCLMQRPRYILRAQRPSIPADHLCMAFRDYAILQFGRHARARVEKMGIRTSDDIGRVVEELVNGHVIAMTAEDNMMAFNGLFTLDQLFGGIGSAQ